MTYQECKNQVLKLLNQYTISGNAVADGYNNQADYIRRIPGLINDAMMEVSTTVRKIEARCALQTEPDPDDTAPATTPPCVWKNDAGEYVSLALTTRHQAQFVLPPDVYQFPSGKVFRYKDGTVGDLGHLHTFMMNGRRNIVIPLGLVRNGGTLLYWRYPTLLPEEDEDIDPDTVLDNVDEVHRAIPYYVAGTLALHDDPFLAATLMNGYEDKLAKMEPPITAEAEQAIDVYDFYRPPYFYGY